MKRINADNISNKAASAALAILTLTSLASAESLYRDDNGMPEGLKREFHFRIPQTPLQLKEFLDDNPGSCLSTEAKLMLADWCFYSREYALALGYYSGIPENAFSGDIREGMIYRKSFSQIKTGFYDEAAAGFRSLALSREFGDQARFYLAYIDYVNGLYDEAYRQFKEIKSTGPKGAEAEFYLNQIDYRNGEYRKVANASERLLSGGEVPEELLAESIRVGGLSFFKLGDKTTARNMLARYAGITGDGAEISALYALGTVYYDDGEPDKALPLFSTVTEYSGPLAQSAWLYIGQIYMQKGDTQAAALAFDKAAKESWDTDVAEAAAYNLAVSSTSGLALPFSDAAAAMENFIESYPASPYSSSLSSYLANAYYGRRDYENALKQIDKVSPQTSETRAIRQKILYQLGITLLQQDKTDRAINALREAADGPEGNVGAEASLWLGDAYYSRKDYSAAARSYEKAISSGLLADNTALADYNLGYSYLKLRNYKAAEKAFRQAENLPGLNPAQKSDAKLRYADCLYYNGLYPQALSVFKDVKLGGGSDAVYAQIREADILGKDGKVNEKISILEGLTDNPDAGVWCSTLLSRLADAYSEKGDDRRAAELYAQMLDNSRGKGDLSQTYYSLATNAENLYRSGDKAAAYAAYKRLESSGITALYPSAVAGIMRTATDKREIREYAAKTAALPGIAAEDMNEAIFTGAEAGLGMEGLSRDNAIADLYSLAVSSDRQWGARAAVILGEELLKQGDNDGAEQVLLALIDDGSDDSYWLARGYIALADVYTAQDKDYLARLYLETLRSNYPGSEKDIMQMISSRLKKLDK